MLQETLQFLGDQISTFLLARTGSDAVKVKPSRVVDEAGKYAFDEDSLCASIINIEEEHAVKSQLPRNTLVDGQQVELQPDVKLNLHVLVAANFKKYDVALKYLSLVLTYFQSHQSFTADAYPTLDARIERLRVELLTLTYEQLNQIWAFIGGKQLPSVVYKVRMVTIQDEAQTEIRPPITAIRTDTHSQ